MRLRQNLLTTGVLLLVVHVCFAIDDPNVSVPVHYDDQAMVVTTKDGTAVVVFKQPVDDGPREGRHYLFRFIGRDGKESRGEGDVYENHQRLPAGQSGPVVNLGSQLQVVAGRIKLAWSFGSSHLGWIYYVPDESRVQFVNADLFEKVDTSRFSK